MLTNSISGTGEDESYNATASFFVYAIFGVISVLIACLLTLYVGPGANGSGTAECMGVLNGINYPDIIGWKTLFVKILGTLFAVVGGLCIGKEGPLAHIGAIIGVMVCYMPFNSFKVLQNDVIRRQLISAGSSTGVACAFGAPIGGALFAYEISKPNTFWSFSMLWRVFFATSLGTFTMSILQSLWKGSPLSISDAGALKFGSVETVSNTLQDLPASIILGAICGVLGATFIHVNISLAILRKKYINTNTKKLIEAAFFAFTTASMFYVAVLSRKY